jgi:uncharacterized protein
VAMRPPNIPSFSLSRRAKIILSVVGILILVLIVSNSLVGIYVDWLWFGEVGFRGVFSAIIGTRAVLFVVFGLLMALMIGGNMVVAYLLRPPFRPLSSEQQNLERYRVALEPRKRLVLILVMIIAFLGAGLAAQGNWRTWMLWRFGGSFGVKDPQFGRDISFFAWDYPVYRLLLGFGFSAVFFSLVFAIAVHYLYGAIRLQTPGPKITLSARRHITILIFLFIVFKALAYWLDRYGLVYSDRGRVTGASYTDVNASLPAKTILFWIAVLIAIAVLASMWLKSARLPAIGFGVLLVLSILISGIYPAAVQQFSVKPNASDKEKPYIARNIQATRDAYGIQTDPKQVTYISNYGVNASGQDKAALSEANTTISNIRILDPNIIEPTFTQQQQIKNQYGFPDKLDIDRYTVNGVTRDYVVAVRELKADNLRGDQTNWINQHTVYTHGYGFVAAQANESVNTKDDFAEGGIPATGFVKMTTPQVYFGELSTDYSIVGASGSREYDGSDQTSHYEGKGGVPLGSFFTRLAFALDYKQTNFLLNDAVSAKGAKIIFNKDPRQRVLKVAPFLKVDGDPYPIVVNGRIVWMVDGYTTMANYPYSERQSLSSLTTDSLTTTNRTATQPDSDINYIRNSVKATVDSYDGTIHLYDWSNGNDPVLKAWMKAFPNLVQPESAMPQDIRDHVRYPEDLFEVQRALLAKYHVDDPVTFYNVRDQWTVPTDPTAASGDQPPYYIIADKPEGNGTASEFQLTSPMKVNNRDNLAAYITVDSDPGPDYGKMTVFKLPTNSTIQGPTQVFNRFSSEPAISRDISLLNQGGSQVLHGNLLTLPVGNTFLYVEPLYVARAGGGFPLLQAILVAYGDQLGYGSSVSDALTHLAPVGQVPPLRSAASPGVTVPSSTSPSATPSPTRPSTSPPSSTAPPPAAGVDTVLKQLDAAFTELQNAYKSGDLARIGEAQGEVQRLTKEYLAARASATATPAPSPTR